MKKQNIKKVTIASLFTGVVIASGLGLGISLANSNTTTNNDLSNVLLKEGTNNVSTKAIDTNLRRQFNQGFLGDITTWGLGNADATAVDSAKPAWNAETGVFTIPNYVESLEAVTRRTPGHDFYPGEYSNPNNPWMSQVKEIRFQSGSRLTKVGNEVFQYMASLTKVYFPQPENMAVPTTKIVFHNGIHPASTATPPGPQIPFKDKSNFSLSTSTNLPKPSKDVAREIVYPSNMRFALVDITAAAMGTNIGARTPTIQELQNLGSKDNILGLINNTIVSNKYYGTPPASATIYPDVEVSSINPLFYNNLSISIPNVAEVFEMMRFPFTDDKNIVFHENIWLEDVKNLYEVTGTTTGTGATAVTNYVPAEANVMTVAQETAKFTNAQKIYANKYAPNSTEYAIFKESLSSGVNHTTYLANLNSNWNRPSHLMSGFETVPEIGVISNRYSNTGASGSITPKDSIYSYNQGATGTAKVEYTANLVGNKGYLVKEPGVVADGASYFRSLKTEAVNKESSGKWVPYAIQESDKVFNALDYRSPNWTDGFWKKDYDYTTKHKLTGDPIYNHISKVLSIPEYIVEMKDVPNALGKDTPIGSTNAALYSYLWESTKNNVEVIKINDFLPNINNIETSIGGDGQLVANVTKVDTVAPQLKTIGNNVFSNFTVLKSLELPKTLKTIGTNLVANATSLTSAMLPNSLTSLGSGAFSNATSLKRFTMPSLGGVTDTTPSNANISYTDMFKGLSPDKLFIPVGDQAKFIAAANGGVTIPTVGNVKYYTQAETIKANTSVNINNVDYKALEAAAIAAKTDPTLLPALTELVTAFNENYPTAGAEGAEPTLNLAKKKAWFASSGVDASLLTDEVLKTLTVNASGDRIVFAGGTLDAATTADDSLLNFVGSATTKLNTVIDVGSFKAIYNKGQPVDLGSILTANSNTPILSGDGGGTNVVADTFGIIFAIVGGVAALILIIALIFIIRRVVLSKRKATEDDSDSDSDSEE